MRQSALFLVACLGLVGATEGCGGGDVASVAPPAPPPAPPAEPPDARGKRPPPLPQGVDKSSHQGLTPR